MTNEQLIYGYTACPICGKTISGREPYFTGSSGPEHINCRAKKDADDSFRRVKAKQNHMKSEADNEAKNT